MHVKELVRVSYDGLSLPISLESSLHVTNNWLHENHRELVGLW